MRILFAIVVAGGVVMTLLHAPPASAAGVFKCVTENGVVRYSSTPCDDGRTEQLDIENPPTDIDAVRERAEQRKEKVEALNEEEARAAEAKQEAAQQADERAKLCATARERLEKSLMERRMYRERDGEREYLSSEEMVAKRQELQEKVAEYCGG